MMNPEESQLCTTSEGLDACEPRHLCRCLQVDIVNANTCSAHNLQAAFAGLKYRTRYLNVTAHIWSNPEGLNVGHHEQAVLHAD